MAIFIGRNIEEKSKAWLDNQRIDYHEQALIDIQLLEPDFALFRKIEKYPKNWIVTSKWAAQWLRKYYQEIEFSNNDTLFCLSDKQAGILADFKNETFVSSEPNLKSLSKLVQQKKQHKLCVCLKGNRSLKASGLETVEVEVYENSLTKPSLENQFDAYLFFSPSGIESFVRGGNEISKNATVVVIGQTTAQKAEVTFQNQLVVSAQQNELITIQTAVQLLQ